MYMYMYMSFVRCLTVIHKHTHVRTHVQAGVVKEMNELVSRFMTEEETRDEVMAEAASVAETHDNPQ